MVIAQYGWLAMLAVVWVNVLLIRRRIRPHREAFPELEPGYRRLIRGFALWMSLPWLVMGIGCMIGEVPTCFHFLFPLVGGPFVWAFWVVCFAEFLILGYWALCRDGAETLVRHPGIVKYSIDSVREMRWMMVAGSAFGIIWNAGFLIWIA